MRRQNVPLTPPLHLHCTPTAPPTAPLLHPHDSTHLSQVPAPFRHIVNDYQEHIFNIHSDIPDGFSELPETLQHRLLLVIHWDLVRQVKIFNALPGSVWIDLMGVMRTASILPGEHIVRTGEKGTCMYFIKNGEVDIIDEHYGRSRVVATLKHGHFFGEIEVLNPGLRIASARAASYCTLLKLTTADFERICCNQVTFRKDLETFATERHERLGLPPSLQGFEAGHEPQPGDRSNMAITANDLVGCCEERAAVSVEVLASVAETDAAGVAPFDGVESKNGNDRGEVGTGANGNASGGDESIAFRVVRYLHDWRGTVQEEV